MATIETFLNGSAVVKYRWLVFELVSRDLKGRYRRSALGVFWTLLNPLLYMGVYSLVFSFYLKTGVKDYVVFIMSALLPWLWFSGAMADGTGSIVAGAGFLRGTKFPSFVLMIVPVLSHMLNMLFSLPILFVLIALHHRTVGLSLLSLPLVMISQVLLTAGFAIIAGAYNVFFRDLQQLVGHLLTVLLFLHPIMYPFSSIPAGIQTYVEWSPLTILVRSYQAIFYEAAYPDFGKLGLLALFSLGVLGLGNMVLRRHQEYFADHL